MTLTIQVLLMIVAILLFCAAAAGVSGRVQLGWLGAALAALAFLWP